MVAWKPWVILDAMASLDHRDEPGRSRRLPSGGDYDDDRAFDDDGDDNDVDDVDDVGRPAPAVLWLDANFELRRPLGALRAALERDGHFLTVAGGVVGLRGGE